MRENTTLAYQVAFFTRTRKLKALKAYLGRLSRKALPEPTAEERAQIVAAAEAWAAKLNAKEVDQ